MYKTQWYGVLRIEDNRVIPFIDPLYQDYLAWVDLGNTPEPEFTLDEYKAKKKSEINDKRLKEIQNSSGTVDVVYNSSTLTFSTDILSISELNETITLYSGSAIPVGRVWKDVYNVDHTATLDLLIAIASAFDVKKQDIWNYSWTLKASVDAASTFEEIDAVVWNFS